MDVPSQPDPVAAARDRMVSEQLEQRGIHQREVLDVMRRLPRERFVDSAMAPRAYDDAALGIAGGQTISQPYMVARMTQELDLPGWRKRHGGALPRVLDVGTGSGYQAAVLAAVGAQVVSIDRDPELAETARTRLHELGLDVRVVSGDGSEGWPEDAPYAGIVVAAAAPAVPPPLVEQLADGGALVLPVGSRTHQELRVLRRAGDHVDARPVEPCVFVPLVGRHGFETGR